MQTIDCWRKDNENLELFLHICNVMHFKLLLLTQRHQSLLRTDDIGGRRRGQNPSPYPMNFPGKYKLNSC